MNAQILVCVLLSVVSGVRLDGPYPPASTHAPPRPLPPAPKIVYGLPPPPPPPTPKAPKNIYEVPPPPKVKYAPPPPPPTTTTPKPPKVVYGPPPVVPKVVVPKPPAPPKKYPYPAAGVPQTPQDAQPGKIVYRYFDNSRIFNNNLLKDFTDDHFLAEAGHADGYEYHFTSPEGIPVSVANVHYHS